MCRCIICIPSLHRPHALLRLFFLHICKDHDAVFWFGDLNYRIDSSLAALDVLEHALSRRLVFLAENDQLNSERGAGRAFDGFREGKTGASPVAAYRLQPCLR